MDDLEKWMIIQFTPYQKPNTFLQIIHAANWLVWHSFPYPPTTAAATFAFSSVCFFFYGLAGAHFARGFVLLDHEDPLLKFHMNVVKSARLKPNRYLAPILACGGLIGIVQGKGRSHAANPGFESD